MKILIIEDDAATAAYLTEALTGAGNEVELQVEGQSGLIAAAGSSWDLLIIDRMLPKLDGLSLVRTLRGAGFETPVLFLTTLSGIDDRVMGLNAGGDDYLVKPFAMPELLARVAALGRRRGGGKVETVLKVADLEMDLIARTVRRAGRLVEVQQRVFQLLEQLLRHAGQLVTRTMLLEKVWEFNFDPRTNIVESHMSRLRGKINTARPGEPPQPELIHTQRGAGYCLRAPE